MGLHIVKSARKWAAIHWYKEFLYHQEMYLKADNSGDRVTADKHYARYLRAKYKYEKYAR